MKTFNKKDIFTIVTAEEAEKYIGQQGYFGDSLGTLKAMIEIDNTEKLIKILDENDCFRFISTSLLSSGTEMWSLFLPAEKVIYSEE